MTTMTTTHAAWVQLRDDVQARLIAGAPEYIERLTWESKTIEHTQRGGLQRLLAHAIEHSPFHHRRLGGVDLATIDPGDLSALPTMTKAEMMSSLDEVFTDRRLRLEDVDTVLAATGVEPIPIHDQYVALASGGSSGQRGVFVFDRNALISYVAALARSLMARLQALGGPPPGGLTIAFVAAASAVHATGLASALTPGHVLPFRFEPVPATLPLPEIVNRLNALQAPALFGYPSMLTRLATEQRAGRLHISPVAVTSTSETLHPEARVLITETFGAPVVDTFGSTEGLVGTTEPGDSILVFNTDMCIVELVDDNNYPVPPGVASAKVLLTNLFNLTQPLIRYELTDTFVQEPEPADHGYLQARVHGRSDDVLHYETADVHPHTIRSSMVTAPEVVDYQVRQTDRGIDICALTVGALDVDALTDRLRTSVATAGLHDPVVTVHVVDRLEFNERTGKVRRFLPLATS